MQNSKLLDLLRTFSGKEKKAFSAFIRAPYFNRNDDVARLGESILEGAMHTKDLTREAVWSVLFPQEAYEEKRLNHLMSFLLKLAEQFIGLEMYQAQTTLTNYHILEGLSSRGLDKNYRFLYEKTVDDLGQAPYLDAGHFYSRFLMEDLERRHQDRQGLRKLHESAQRAADNLDYFYLTEKLKYTCAMLNSQQVVATPFAFHFLEEVRHFLENTAIPVEVPGIGIYFCILKLLTQEQSDADFEALKGMLEQHQARFALTEMAEMYQYALNYCIRQTRKGREQYVAEALDLYEDGVESGILLNNGKLSPWHFKNIIKLGLRQGRFDWTERFILDKNALLEDDFKTDALHYNLADLYFYTERYDLVRTHLNKVEFTDIHYNLGAKLMLAKIYYEQGEDDALFSLLHSFKTYLQRNRTLAEDIRKAYLNFIKILQTIQRTPKSNLSALQTKIASLDTISAKAWLLKQVKG